MTNKKRLSRLLTALLVWLCLVLWIFSFSAFAEEEIPSHTMSSNDVQVTAGNSVTVYLYVENFASVGALDLYAFYDPEVMTLTSSSKQTIANNAQVSINTNTPGEACFSAISTEGMSGNGNIWSLTFKINSNAEAGTYYVNFAAGNAYDLLLEPISINATSCAVTVNRPSVTVTPQKINVYASYLNNKYEQGDTFQIKLNTSSAKGMASGEFVITYDPYMLSPTSVNLGSKLTSATGAIWSVNDKTPGYIKISYAALTGITGSIDPLVNVGFEVIGSVSEDTVSSIGMELMHPYDSALNTMTGSSTTADISLAAPTEVIVLPEITLENAVLMGDTLSVDIIASGSTGIAAGDFILTYDKSLLECVSFDCPTDGCMVIGNIKAFEGKLLFSFICEDGIGSDTVLTSVKFRVLGCTDGAPDLSITGRNLVTSTYEGISASYGSNLKNIDLSHRLDYFDARSATCTEIGWNAYETCSRCEHTTYKEIPATGHNYTSVVTPPTCTENGYTTHTCHCGDSYADNYVNALGHNYGEWTQTLAPTCTEVGTERKDCENCDHYETREIEALGHNYSTEWTTDKEATCTEAGSKSHHCTRCDSKADITEIPVIEHSWNDGEVTKEPTNEETGEKLFTCTSCGHTRTEEIPKLTFITGNFDDNEEITSSDAVYLLMYTFFPEDYPVSEEQKAQSDFNGDGEINSSDAVHLLMYTFFPEDYPLTNAQPAALTPTNMSVKREDEEE